MSNNEKSPIHESPVFAAGVGNAILSTYTKLGYKSIKNCLIFSAIVFVIGMSTWIATNSYRNNQLLQLYYFSYVFPNDEPRYFYILDEKGDRREVTVRESNGNAANFFTPIELRDMAYKHEPAVQRFTMFFLWWPVVSLLIGVGLFLIFLRVGKNAQSSRRIDGALDLVSDKVLSRLVAKESKAPYSFAKVKLPSDAPMCGILAMGSQGSGKTIAIKDLATQVFKNQKKAIIFDMKGDMFKAFYRPGKDFFFNPALEGSVPWSIFGELRYTYDADTLAQAFLPPKGGVVNGAAAFFEDAARALFSVILLRLAQNGAVNTADIAKAFLEMPEEEMEHLIRQSIASSAIAGDSKGQKQGVISSIAIYLSGLASISNGSWTITDFMNRDDDARLFILGTEDTKAMFLPIYRLLLTVAFQTIAAKQELCYEDKYWFFLDEVIQIGDIRLDDYLATLREYGVCIVCGIQSLSQITASISKERAQTVMNCFNTLLALRCNEPSMRTQIASIFGKQKQSKVSQNQALAVNEARDGAGLNTGEASEWLVSPEALDNLPKCCGYLKISGQYPVAYVNYEQWMPNKGKRPDFAPINGLPRRSTTFSVQKQNLPEGMSAFDQNRHEMERQHSSHQTDTPKEADSAKPHKIKEQDMGAIR